MKAGWNLEHSYADLPTVFFSQLHPTPVVKPKLVVLNESLAAELGLNAEALRNDEGVAVLAGNAVPEGAVPLAQAYAGHQFGHFTRLGDGRAILIGEQITPRGERFDIQLKGRGGRLTPAAATVGRRSGRCCVSTSSARRCTHSASRRRAAWPS